MTESPSKAKGLPSKAKQPPANAKGQQLETNNTTHVEIEADESNLKCDSVILLEQIRTIDKRRLKRKVTFLNDEIVARVDEALKISVGLIEL